MNDLPSTPASPSLQGPQQRGMFGLQCLDSRYWGFVPRSNIMGRPLVIYLSVPNPKEEDEPGVSDGKLLASGQMVTHFRQLAR
jgi:hypothetical protein